MRGFFFIAVQKPKERGGGSFKVQNDSTCQRHHLCSTACFHCLPSQNHSVHVLFFHFNPKGRQNLVTGFKAKKLCPVIYNKLRIKGSSCESPGSRWRGEETSSQDLFKRAGDTGRDRSALSCSVLLRSTCAEWAEHSGLPPEVSVKGRTVERSLLAVWLYKQRLSE